MFSSRSVCFSSAGMIEVSHWPVLGISCRGGSGGNWLHSARVFGVKSWCLASVGFPGNRDWVILSSVGSSPVQGAHFVSEIALSLCRNVYEHGLLLNGKKYVKNIKISWELESKPLFRLLQKPKLPNLCVVLPKPPFSGSDPQEIQLGLKSWLIFNGFPIPEGDNAGTKK